MNYYIQGDAANADKIKAAFERLGYDTTGWKFDVEGGFYYTTERKRKRIDIACGNFLINLIKTHPDYKELELPKPHYDISNFKPYQKVLIRFGNNDTWRADFFSHIKEDRGRYFVGIGYANKQCIPFEGNEHLLGTTDMCDEMYINW